MSAISAKQFIRSLSDQRHFDILSGSLTNKIHWNNRRCSDRFLKTSHNLWERFFKCRLRQDDGSVNRRQLTRRFGAIGQLIVSVACAVSHGIRGPGLSIQIHESQQQPRINSTAEEQANGHITDKMSFNRLLVERQKLFLCLIV